jgi:hypothetical protein
MDLTTSTPELMVHGSPHVAKTVKHVPEQGRKARTVQPITMESSVSPEGGLGVVIHLSNNKEEVNHQFIH